MATKLCFTIESVQKIARRIPELDRKPPFREKYDVSYINLPRQSTLKGKRSMKLINERIKVIKACNPKGILGYRHQMSTFILILILTS